tara:strand:- start:586 stop:822 length:237 start_codon:yes stop_codon:yes gene_type:complete
MKATRKYFIRVRAEYVGYYEVEAKDISEAEHKASDLLHEDMNDPIYGSFDFEQYDPIPDKYQSIGSDNQDIFIQEEEV